MILNSTFLVDLERENKMPLVTRNGDEFRRVTGLDVREY